MFLGEDLLAWLVLAIGGAMSAGSLAALIHPPRVKRSPGDLEKAPVVRCAVCATVGLLAAVWALVSLWA